MDFKPRSVTEALLQRIADTLERIDAMDKPEFAATYSPGVPRTDHPAGGPMRFTYSSDGPGKGGTIFAPDGSLAFVVHADESGRLDEAFCAMFSHANQALEVESLRRENRELRARLAEKGGGE